jgi:DNA-binding SARP family transcriptional activator/Flp pilus assembly protein TadD
MTATLAIQLLGDFRVLVRGRAVTEAEWSRRHARLLVKLLALEPRHQLHREQLMAAIWPDLDAEAGAANLHKVIHLARHALEPRLRSGANSQFIVTSQQQVQLRAQALSIDVEEFERLAALALASGRTPDFEAALALYRGDLLADDPYADWCSQKRDSLRTLREQLMMTLGRRYAAAQQHERAIAQFEALVASFSANEDAHRELMTLYALTGRRSDALRQFRRCQDAVRAELDAEPEDATLHLYRRIVSREIQPLPRAEAGRPSPDSTEAIAVLPFENETDDSEIDYLSPGIADSVIRNLSQVRGLRVLAFSTVSRFKRRVVDPRKLGRELGVFAVVTGRIGRIGDTLFVSTELVDTSDGSRLWGDQARLPQTDVLAVQERISREISEKLRARLTAAQRRLVVKRYTADPEAYRLYLKGRFHWNKRTAEGLTRGIDYFESSIERDPSYALAYSGLADCYNLLSLYSVLPPTETMPKAKAAAHQALEIDPALAEAHTSLAYTYLYYDWNWTAAEQEFQRALAINPNYATAHHWYHECLTAMGRFDEQMAEILLAQELDPLSLIINTDVAWGLYYGRVYDEAIDQLHRTLELDANFAVAHLMLGFAYAQKRLLSEARSHVQRAIELSGDSPSTLAVAALGYIHALDGRRQDGVMVMERLARLPGARYATDYCQAMVFTGLGEHQTACERLEAAVRERYDRLIYLNVEPIFDPLRDEPRFRELVALIGLPSRTKD